MNEEKPIKPLEIDPKYFLGLIESFIKSYPHYFRDIKILAEKAEDECEKLDRSEIKGLAFKGIKADYKNFKPFWKEYLDIEDLEASGPLIKNAVFEKINPSNINAIFKTAGKQNLSYSLVVSKVGIKIELLIKTLRTNIKDKGKLNKLIFDEITKYKKQLNKNIKNLVWDRLDNRVYSRIYFVIEECSVNNKVNLPRLTIADLTGRKKNSIYVRMAEASDKFYQAFDPIVKKIDIKNLEKKL